MPRLIWSPSALRAIDRRYKFLKGKSPVAATPSLRSVDHPSGPTAHERRVLIYRNIQVMVG